MNNSYLAIQNQKVNADDIPLYNYVQLLLFGVI